jgi:hypothetical protein
VVLLEEQQETWHFNCAVVKTAPQCSSVDGVRAARKLLSIMVSEACMGMKVSSVRTCCSWCATFAEVHEISLLSVLHG